MRIVVDKYPKSKYECVLLENEHECKLGCGCDFKESINKKPCCSNLLSLVAFIDNMFNRYFPDVNPIGVQKRGGSR